MIRSMALSMQLPSSLNAPFKSKKIYTTLVIITLSTVIDEGAGEDNFVEVDYIYIYYSCPSKTQFQLMDL